MFSMLRPAVPRYCPKTRFCRPDPARLEAALPCNRNGGPKFLVRMLGLFSLLLLTVLPARANIPGGGTGTGPDVTLTDNGSTVTLANGIVSIVITKTSAQINTINYTYNNSGTVVTNPLLNGGGYLYWFQNGGTFIAGPFTESVVANTGSYAEISLSYASPTNGIMDLHYSMLRGSPGFYTTAILTHRTQDGITHIELRPNIYGGTQFNWMSVDAARNRLMEVSGGASVGVNGAPKECYLWTNGIYAGQYEDKYKYSADLATLPAWGWSSVGAGGSNAGLWNITASPEYYPGGPMERSLMEHIGTTILNVITGGYYGLATDNMFTAGELWSKVYGPYLYYCNNVTNTLTATNLAAQALYNDALAQGAAEQTAWPYAWFTNASYTPASGRGVVTGKIIINDAGNPNASAAGLWVGVVQQPATNANVYDFQQWTKPYQFWGKTDAGGNYVLPNVMAGANYTLYAFGPGAANTFLSQTQTGGNPPLLYDLPAAPFSVTVTAGATNNVGTVTWTPSRVGATVFEIGYPDRTAAKFRHGDDYWVGDIGPSASQPSPIWSKWLEYPFDFPNGVNYVVGQSRWSTDWNFIQPVTRDSLGNYNSSSSTITFNLATAPTNGATASLYLGLCSDYYSAVVISVNGVNAASLSGLSASPNGSVPSTGYYVAYGDSDSNIREGNNGAFTDERLTFSAAALHQGQNTLTISFREISANYFADHLMYDYVRLELTGYVPPPPASVTAYAGNHGNLVCWPVVPGATSYNIFRATTVAGTYGSLTNGVTGPVCGSGAVNATWLDTAAGNGTNYFYVVRAVNPTGSSTNSPPSAGVTPAAGIAVSAPAAPGGLAMTTSGHQTVALKWNAAAGANFYSVWRSTLMDNGGGASNILSTILLNNATTGTNYTDTTPTDGSIYTYAVTATSAGGTSGNSSLVAARALPVPPASAPVSPTAAFYQATNIVLNWTPVSGAVGYLIKRATSASGPFLFLQSVTATVYYDLGLNAGSTYYYQIVAVNAAGVSGAATNSANALQPAPASLSASGASAQVTLTWSAAAGATSYTLKRGTSSGTEAITVVTGYTGTSYTNSGLSNGTIYYYVVTATGSGGTSGNSAEANATASAASNGTWTAAGSGNWSYGPNWSGDLIAYGSGNTADFSTLSLAADVTVTLDSDRTLSGLVFGDGAGSFNWTVTGTNSLTLGASPTINVENQTATLSVPLAGTNGLTKTGAGTLVLGGATKTFTNGLAVNAGTLTLDFSAANSPATNLVAAGNALALGGGALWVNGGLTVSSSQTFVATTLNVGGSALAAAPSAGMSNPVVTLGSMTANVGGTVAFSGPATVDASGNVPATATLTTTTAGTGVLGAVGSFGSSSSKGAYATVGLYDFASTDTTGGLAGSSPYLLLGGSQVPGFYQTTGITTTTGAFDVTANVSDTSNSAGSSPMIRFNAPGALTVTFNYSSCNGIQGILVTPKCGAFNETLANNGLQFVRSTTVANDYGVIWQNNLAGYLNVNCSLQPGRLLNGGSGNSCGLVQAGRGTVVYAGLNDYDLATYLNDGYSVITADSGFGRPSLGGTVNLNGGTIVANATFTMDNAGANARSLVVGAAGGGLVATAGNTMTLDGVISGAGSLTLGLGTLPGSGVGTANPTPVIGNGTVALTTNNTFTGDIAVNAGTLGVTLNNNINNPVSGALGNTAVARNLTVNNGGTVNFTAGNALGSTLTTVGATLVINNGGTVTDTANDIETLGSVQLNGGTLTGTGGASAAFQMYALRGTVTVGGTNASTISGSGTNAGYHLAAPTTFNVAEVTGGASPDLYVPALLVDQDGAGTIYGHLGAAGSLSKTGAGTLVLSGTNLYSGGTTVAGGTLLVNGDNSGATGAVMVASGAILGGTGTVGGAATVQSGGTLTPGVGASGRLTFTRSLTLAAGATTVIALSKSPTTNAAVTVSGALTNGGLLSVTNLSGNALAAGDSFKLLNAGSYSGGFSALNLPALAAGLTWNTNGLNTNGLLAVVSTVPPQFGNVTVSGGGFTFVVTNGTPGASCYVLGSTNLLLPLVNWTRVATNYFDANGSFRSTNAINPNVPQLYYQLLLP